VDASLLCERLIGANVSYAIDFMLVAPANAGVQRL